MPSLATRHSPLVTHNELAAASLWNSLFIQIRVIKALLMREILTRYGRHNIGFLWLFVEPMIYVGIHPFIWSFIGAHEHDVVGAWGIAVTGFPSFFLYRNMVNRCLSAIGPNASLLFHRPVKILDVYLSRILLEAAGETMTFVFLAAIITFFGLMPLPYDPLQVAGGWFMLAWFGAGLALFLAPLCENSHLLAKLWPSTAFVMFFVSGAFYSTAMLPASAREILLWVPMVSGVEYLREGYFGGLAHFHYDMGYLTIWNLMLTLAGLWQISLMPRRMATA